MNLFTALILFTALAWKRITTLIAKRLYFDHAVWLYGLYHRSPFHLKNGAHFSVGWLYHRSPFHLKMSIISRWAGYILKLFIIAQFFGSHQVLADSHREIILEFNKIEDIKGNCLLTFVVSNKLKSDIEKLAYEVVLFDANQKVERMTVFDFRNIAAEKSRVRQFQLTNKKCEELSRFLINGVSACNGPALEIKQCSKNLTISNKTNIEFLN